MGQPNKSEQIMSTKIEWCDETWNPITGCKKVSDGCMNCYAERMAKRLAGRFGYPADDPFRPTFHPDRLAKPMMWIRHKKIFVCSMSDFFIASLDWMCQILQIIHKCPQHTFMILTKRTDSLNLFNHVCGWHEPHNIWVGATIENQKVADERTSEIAQTPVARRFLSMEPLLEFIDPDLTNIDWVIVGAETGPGARYMDPSWARYIHGRCQEASIPFFIKQMSNKEPIPDDLMIREFPLQP
jgi:protein gp37